MICIKKDFNLYEIFKLSINYLISALVMFICCYLVNFIGLDPLINVILKVIIGGIVYVVILLIMKDEFFNEILNRLLINFRSEKNEI